MSLNPGEHYRMDCIFINKPLFHLTRDLYCRLQEKHLQIK